MDSSVNTCDGRVMDPVYSGQYPQMGCYQPSVTHRDFTLEPFLAPCSPTTGGRNLESYGVKRPGHWNDTAYLSSHIYGHYGDYGRSCDRWLTIYKTHYPEKFTFKGYPPNNLHVQPALHCFLVKPLF